MWETIITTCGFLGIEICRRIYKHILKQKEQHIIVLDDVSEEDKADAILLVT